MRDGLDLVKEFEAYREFAYPDPASDLARAVRAKGLKPSWGFKPARGIIAALPGDLKTLSGAPWTCGYGETKGVNPETHWYHDEALQKFENRYAEFERGVLKACKVAPTPSQLGAMTSLAYNIGLGWEGASKPKGAKDGFRQSSVLKAHNRGDSLSASRAFGLWNKANGKVEKGLTRRRAAEAALYLSSPVGTDVDIIGTVEPESNLTASPINRASVAAGVTAAVATVTEVTKAVADVKDATVGLESWLVPALLIAVIAMCGYIIYERIKVRKEGWS